MQLTQSTMVEDGKKRSGTHLFFWAGSFFFSSSVFSFFFLSQLLNFLFKFHLGSFTFRFTGFYFFLFLLFMPLQPFIPFSLLLQRSVSVFALVVVFSLFAFVQLCKN